MEEYERPWSDLPPDLLSIIISYLFGGDSVNFRLICKSYRSVYVVDRRIPPPNDSSLTQSPCLMFLGNNFFHPIYNVIYRMDIAKLTGAIIQDSKYGWFLMAQNDDNLFFYNPITKVRIQLPHVPADFGLASMHFSSPPTSLECQVIGFGPVLGKKVEIFTIKRNQDSWTAHEFPQKRDFKSSECKPILYNGVYYCLGRGGNLIIYDPKENKCSWTDHDKALRKRLRSYCHSYMVESDGELLAVFVAPDGKWVGVFRLNLSSLVFEKVHSLGNRMLFVSQPACFSETALVRGTGNKIYLPKFHGKDGLFYSLATNKFHSFAAPAYSTDNFYGVKGYSLSTWIKPTFDTTCVEKFNW